MLKSKMYTKYFPIKTHKTDFSEEEKEILYNWARDIRTEANARLYEGKKAYDLRNYNEKTMMQMIENNTFDDYYLVYLNVILLRHKYYAFLSIWTYPMLSDSKIEKYFGCMDGANTESKAL